jgi:hypothetical protein
MAWRRARLVEEDTNLPSPLGDVFTHRQRLGRVPVRLEGARSVRQE